MSYFFFETDTQTLFQSTGTAWTQLAAAVGGGGGGGGAVTQIARTVLTVAAANLTFSAIAGTYADLELTLQARGDTAANSVPVNGQFNGDTAANYDSQYLFGGGATAGAGETLGATSFVVANLPAANAPAGAATSARVLIVNYAGTTFRTQVVVTESNDLADSTTNVQTTKRTGVWRSTAAITSIVLTPGAGNFAAGTTATLWGRT